MSISRRSNQYGQLEPAMRWLKENDPDALREGYAGRLGIIDNTRQSQIQRHEFSTTQFVMLEEMALSRMYLGETS